MTLREEQSNEKLNRALLAGWQAPDLLGIGVLVCDASSRLLIANQTALDILRAQDGLQLSSDGRLCAPNEDAHQLTETVRRCASDKSSMYKTASACFALSIHRTSGKAPLTLLARPFRPPATEGPTSMTLVLLLNPPAAEEDGIGSLLRLVGCEDSMGSRVHRDGLQ